MKLRKQMKTVLVCKILIVDDHPSLLQLVTEILQQAGFANVIQAESCASARLRFQQEKPDAVLLDLMLPDGDGFLLLQEFREQNPDLPVLFLSARDEDENRLLALGLGADDYLTKPFLPRELVLRLSAVLRRAYFPSMLNQKETHDVFQLGGLQVNLQSGELIGPEKMQTLTAREFALLKKLAENHGRIVTTDDLCRAVWDGELWGYENALMVHIRRLREKIEPDPSKPRYLLTVRGLGYRLVKEGAK